jgi:hypothetical protein
VNGLRRFLWTPIGWFAFLVGELMILLLLKRVLLPAATWRIGVGVLVVVLAGLVGFNLWFRRRFLPWDEGPGSSG